MMETTKCDTSPAQIPDEGFELPDPGLSTPSSLSSSSSSSSNGTNSRKHLIKEASKVINDTIKNSDLSKLTITDIQSEIVDQLGDKSGSIEKTLLSRMEIYRQIIDILKELPEHDRKMIKSFHNQYILPLRYGLETIQNGFNCNSLPNEFAKSLSTNNSSSPLINGLKMCFNDEWSEDDKLLSAFSKKEKFIWQSDFDAFTDFRENFKTNLRKSNINRQQNPISLILNNQINVSSSNNSMIDDESADDEIATKKLKSKVPTRKISTKRIHQTNSKRKRTRNDLKEFVQTKFKNDHNIAFQNYIDESQPCEQAKSNIPDLFIKNEKANNNGTNQLISNFQTTPEEIVSNENYETDEQTNLIDDDALDNPTTKKDDAPSDSILKAKTETHALDRISLHQQPTSLATSTSIITTDFISDLKFTNHFSNTSISDVKFSMSPDKSTTLSTSFQNAQILSPPYLNAPSSEASEPSLLSDNGECSNSNSNESSSQEQNLVEHYSREHFKKLLIGNNSDGKPQAVFWKKLIRYSAYRNFDLEDKCSNSTNIYSSSEKSILSVEDSVVIDKENENDNYQRIPNGVLSSPVSSGLNYSETEIEDWNENKNNKGTSKLKIIDLANNYTTEQQKTCFDEGEIFNKNCMEFTLANSPNGVVNGSTVEEKKSDKMNKCWCGDGDVSSVHSLNSQCNSSISSPRSFSTLDSDLDVQNHQSLLNDSDSDDDQSDTSKILNGNGYYGSIDSGSIDIPILSDSSEVVHSDASTSRSDDTSCKNIKTVFKRSDFSDSENSDVEEMDLETMKNGDHCSAHNHTGNHRFKMDHQFERISGPLFNKSNKKNSNKKNIHSKKSESAHMSYKNNLHMIVTGFSTKSKLEITSIKRKKSFAENDQQNSNKKRNKYHNKYLDEENNSVSKRSELTKNTQNPGDDDDNETSETDEELARRLQQEEYLAARPARRRVAIVAYDRLHEQLSRLKKDTMLNGMADDKRITKPISRKRQSTTKDDEEKKYCNNGIKNQKHSTNHKGSSENVDKSSNSQPVIPSEKSFEDIARFFGASVKSPQKICSRMHEYAIQNDLVFTKNSSYYLNCDKTLSNLFGVQGSIRFFTLTRQIYKSASKC